jgi:hypothetical protein
MLFGILIVCGKTLHGNIISLRGVDIAVIKKRRSVCLKKVE